MKKLTLLSLHLKEFKGLTFDLVVNGRNANVYADNGLGKTTLFDSLCFLFFGKDSQFKSDFEIKNLNGDGSVEHNLEHEVKGLFKWDGRVIELKKVYSEIWTKKRGSASKEMTGHTTEHFIDSVPVQKKEYQQRISEIASEENFKLLTSPAYFSQQMKWQDRRALLMSLCGDVTDEQVLSSDADKFGPLALLLQKRSIEDHKKVIVAQRKEINEQLSKIPVRIDEVVKGMADISGINHLAEIERINSLVGDLEKVEAKISALKNGGAMADLQRQLAEVETELIQAKNAYTVALSALQNEKDAALAKLLRQNNTLSAELGTLRNTTVELQRTDSIIEKLCDELRAEWEEINKSAAPIAGECPCCGQEIPEHQQKEAIAKFNLKKSKELEAIQTTGKGERKNQIEIKAKISSATAEIAAKSEELEALQAVITLADQAPVEPPEKEGAAVAAAQAKVTGLVAKIEVEKMGAGNNQGLIDAEALAASFKEAIDTSRQKIAKVEAAQIATDRKIELEAEQKKMARDFEKLEGELFLLEEFDKAKAEAIEGQVNGMFKMARFRLFDQGINGSIQPCCSVLYNGVPFETSLNNGARINVGLDIINTISQHQGLSVPIFCDNSESVTTVIPTDAQLIKLVVSKGRWIGAPTIENPDEKPVWVPDDTLRVEVEA